MKTHLLLGLLFFILFLNIECFASDLPIAVISKTEAMQLVVNNTAKLNPDELALSTKMMIYILIASVYGLCWWRWKQ